LNSQQKLVLIRIFKNNFTNKNCKILLPAILVCITILSYGQKHRIPILETSVYFPYPMQQRKWHSSAGLTFTRIPANITEDVQVAAPAGDLHILRKLKHGFYIDGRVNFQFVQNQFSVGPRWAYAIDEFLSVSIGDDFAWWFGILNIEGFHTKADGWMNYPNLSFGYQFKKQVLLTLKGEAIINLSYQSNVGDDLTDYNISKFSGWACTFALEQPFFNKTNFILAFKGQYTNFFYQTWSLYPTLNRKLFYPEIIVGFIL
jgi:hypothetical protein